MTVSLRIVIVLSVFKCA